MKDYEEKVLNIMDSAKNSIKTQLDKAYKSGYEDAKSELGQNAINLAHKESDRAYQQGLEDAWEAARKIILAEGLPGRELVQIFGTSSSHKILKESTASETIAKIKKYKNKQKQDSEIKVGDEVYLFDENHPRVVTNIFDDSGRTRAIQITGSGKWVVDNIDDIHKTGKHYPQIVEVFAEMRGKSE